MKHRYLYGNLNTDYNNQIDDDYHEHAVSNQVYYIIFSSSIAVFTIFCLCYLYYFKEKTQIIIEHTRTITVENVNYNQDIQYTPEICSICLENFSGDNPIGKLSCNHYYHIECINEWFTNKNYFCPYCKREDI